MDNLPRASWFVTVAARLSPGLALLMADSIGRFLRRVLFGGGQGDAAVPASRSGSGINLMGRSRRPCSLIGR
jgi:hypothetical protein